MDHLKQTPIMPWYKEERVKTIDFGGWEMPVQFTSIKQEHFAVRNQAGLFDVSHMGEAFITGTGSRDFLQRIITNDIEKLEPNKALYTLMCNEHGGTIDDLLIYQLDADKYMLVLNAANTEKDILWLQNNADDTVQVKDVSSEFSLLALQGPKSQKILQKLTNTDLSEISFFRFRQNVEIGGAAALVSRTGYTGEDGFEIYCPSGEALGLWKNILDVGRADGLLPCGLGARDTLRFEAKLPLYGQEIDETISPIEAGLGFAVKLKKRSDFIGKDALLQEKESGVKRKLAGIEMIEKGIPRSGYAVLDKSGSVVGHITSGTQSPTLGKNIGLALVKAELAELENELIVQVRKKLLTAKVITTPFYKRES
ncbi:glycine cleavage system aminomethyltransferase GcvT [Alteribacillus sp. HJP-4]|uniref:glycine cleavage system aminomethyltransferase GcvT n=1 Tax=Alteribacillus sp. HJP-4 TaxID=2775394 RepID=UPI0035CD0705